MPMRSLTRRRFLSRTLDGLAASVLVDDVGTLGAHVLGGRPARARDIAVLGPASRVPVALIIDDSTCLVNLNRFAMPQFDEAFGGANQAYKKPWREWPVEIPDRFVRRFGEWCADQGVKGKYSIVPYPACVGRLDRGLPGWTRRELADSLELVRSLMLPNWDIHPEIVTHTRVIDLETGHPYADHSLRFMENWEWTTGRSADEIAQYMAYALQILKNVGLPCDGITTPGGFAIQALPELAEATLQAVRDVFRAEIPHYFRHSYSKGHESVAPRVELGAGTPVAQIWCPLRTCQAGTPGQHPGRAAWQLAVHRPVYRLAVCRLLAGYPVASESRVSQSPDPRAAERARAVRAG
ncbi:MAG: hypothetical protein GEV06_25795 [Luteitalea sp.]|nr:hypothetical protein [Luteitalea sp.]